MIKEYFIDDELPEYLPIKSILFEFEVKILYVCICRLILFLVKLLEERVLQRLLSTQPLRRVIAQ